MARNGHPSPTAGCLLSGVKRKSASASSTSEFDPLRHQPRGILGGHNKKAFAKGLRCARNRRNGLHLGILRSRLSEFRRIFAGNLVDLLPSQLLWRYPGRTTGVAEEAVQAGRRHDPEQVRDPDSRTRAKHSWE